MVAAEVTSTVREETTMTSEAEVATTTAEEANTTIEAQEVTDPAAPEGEATIEAVTEEDTVEEAEEDTTRMATMHSKATEAAVDTSQVIVTETVKHKAQHQWSAGEPVEATAQMDLQRMEAINELCVRSKIRYLIVKLNHDSLSSSPTPAPAHLGTANSKS